MVFQLEVSAEILENQTEVLKGAVFVVSGVFYQMSRNELKKAIEDNGGKVSASISKKNKFYSCWRKHGAFKN